MLFRGWHRSTGGATPEPPERLLRTESNRCFNNTVVQAAGDLSAQEAKEEGAIQEMCMDILGSLDVSERRISKVSHTLPCCYSLPLHHMLFIPFQHPRSVLLCALKHIKLREIQSPSLSGSRNADMLNCLVPYSSCGRGCCCTWCQPSTPACLSRSPAASMPWLREGTRWCGTWKNWIPISSAPCFKVGAESPPLSSADLW